MRIHYAHRLSSSTVSLTLIFIIIASPEDRNKILINFQDDPVQLPSGWISMENICHGIITQYWESHSAPAGGEKKDTDNRRQCFTFFIYLFLALPPLLFGFLQPFCLYFCGNNKLPHHSSQQLGFGIILFKCQRNLGLCDTAIIIISTAADVFQD